MKRIILLSDIALGTLACSDPPCFELTPQQKEWLPYYEGDTISFVSSDSVDSISYVVSLHLIEEITDGKVWDDICISISYFDLKRFSTNGEHFDSPPSIYANNFNYGVDQYINIDNYGHYDIDSTMLFNNLKIGELELVNGKKYSANIVYSEQDSERGRSLYYAAYTKEKGIIAFKVANRPDIRFELVE